MDLMKADIFLFSLLMTFQYVEQSLRVSGLSINNNEINFFVTQGLWFQTYLTVKNNTPHPKIPTCTPIT